MGEATLKRRLPVFVPLSRMFCDLYNNSDKLMVHSVPASSKGELEM